MQLGVELRVDVVDDVVLQPLHVEVNGLEEGRQAGGRDSQAYGQLLIIKK